MIYVAYFLGGDHLFDCQMNFNASNGFVHINSKRQNRQYSLNAMATTTRSAFFCGAKLLTKPIWISPHKIPINIICRCKALWLVWKYKPHPFAKTAQEDKPLNLEMYFEPNDVIRFSANYGDNISLAYSLRKGHTPQTLGAHLYIGEKQHAKFREDGIFD